MLQRSLSVGHWRRLVQVVAILSLLLIAGLAYSQALSGSMSLAPVATASATTASTPIDDLLSAQVLDEMDPWWERWSLLLLVPLVATFMWRNYQRTGEIPLKGFLLQFGAQKELDADAPDSNQLGRIGATFLDQIRFSGKQAKVIKYFLWIILVIGFASFTSSIWLPFLKG